jgi:mono/diheme cytochrome c family protein
MQRWQNDRFASRHVFVSAIGLALLACSGRDRNTADTAMGATDTTPAATPAGPDQITPTLIALGDSIFAGKAAGGICYTCHGADAKGTQLGPDLTDPQWLNGDGSYAFIVQMITAGVATPKQFAAPMPPFGQMLTPEQIHATAAYVYSLTHPAVGS